MILFGVLLCLFYPELFFAKSAPLVNDHWEQHFPWAWTLGQSLRHGMLPVWTPLIHGGFPIAAESQIGIFYLPNLILFGFLPIHWAYSYIVLIHFLISGLATFGYARVSGLSREAAFLAAFLFVFGTSYGGAYYNVTSLKTIAWFPVMLLCFEVWLRGGRFRYLLLAAAAGAQALVAGYMQVAALCLFVLGMYVLVRLFQTRRSFGRFLSTQAVPLVVAAGTGLLLALPQILLTLQLALLSNRSGTEEGYAYVGSMSPLALLSLFLPNTQGLFRGNCLYAGLFAVFCLLAVLISPPRKHRIFLGAWGWMTFFSLAFALGSWSPVYLLFIKLTHFYAFRTPSKFLIFFNFFWILLAAAGFERLWRTIWTRRGTLLQKKTAVLFGVLVCLFLALTLWGEILMQWIFPWLEKTGEWLVRTTIYGQAGHPHTLEVYREKLQSYFDLAGQIFSLRYVWSRWMAVMLFLYGLWTLSVWGRIWTCRKLWLGAGVLLLVVDLYGFSYADLRTDFMSYDRAAKHGQEIDRLIEAKAAGELGRLYVFRPSGESLDLIPSVNMLYGVEDIGAYSPLVMSRYYETLGRFGNVNDSNQVLPVTEVFVSQRRKILDALDVSHVLSPIPFNADGWSAVHADQQRQIFLYRSTVPHSRFFAPVRVEVLQDWPAVRDRFMAPGFDPRESLLLAKTDLPEGTELPALPAGTADVQIHVISSSATRLVLRVITNQPCFFVWMQTFYEGWTARLDGRLTGILPAYGQFNTVWIAEADEHELEFDYSLSEALKQGWKSWTSKKV